jgi:hypothetical protein
LTQSGHNDTALYLLLAVQSLRASRLLPSKRGKGNLLIDLSKLISAVDSHYYNLKCIKPLLDAVLNKQPDEVIWDAVYESIPPSRALSSFTSTFANSTAHRKGVDVPNRIPCMILVLGKFSRMVIC